MRTIAQLQETVPALCGVQPMPREPLRWSRHVVFANCADGLLAYHTLMCELVLLDANDDNFINYSDGTREELVARWFLVGESFDERTQADQVRKVFELYHPFDSRITHYTVLTTTGCNARCAYCSEAGMTRRSMSLDTAKELGRYIARACAGKEAHLKWFGGEPLVNIPAIDAICATLRDEGASYTSKTTSNGYLFDQATIERAVSLWHLTQAQITFDGAEEMYNKVKSYVGVKPGESPYRRVLRNVGLLLDAGVRVSLRINVAPDNHESIELLIDELEGLFAGRPELHVYATPLHDFTLPGTPVLGGRPVTEAAHRFRDILKEKGLGGWSALEGGWRLNRCMADSPDSVTVLPDGSFGRCEFLTEGEDRAGSLWGEGLDARVLDEWRRVVRVSECDVCPMYPLCRQLVNCPWCKGLCTEEGRRSALEHLRKAMIETWRSVLRT